MYKNQLTSYKDYRILSCGRLLSYNKKISTKTIAIYTERRFKVPTISVVQSSRPVERAQALLRTLPRAIYLGEAHATSTTALGPVHPACHRNSSPASVSGVLAIPFGIGVVGITIYAKLTKKEQPRWLNLTGTPFQSSPQPNSTTS